LRVCHDASIGRIFQAAATDARQVSMTNSFSAYAGRKDTPGAVTRLTDAFAVRGNCRAAAGIAVPFVNDEIILLVGDVLQGRNADRRRRRFDDFNTIEGAA
jgi:hypothetical protein